jgi:transcriptional regulator with XRE-family HTH domain
MARKRNELDITGGGGRDDGGPGRGKPRKARENVPLSVQKIYGALEARGVTDKHVEEECGLFRYRIYGWRTQAGQPTTTECVRISQVLDLSLDYLVDDATPVSENPPRRADTGATAIAQAARTIRLDMKTIEDYLYGIRLMVDLGITPSQLTRLVVAAAGHRKDEGLDSEPRATGPRQPKTDGGTEGGQNGNSHAV